MTQLPRTISDLDALATSLAPQGHVILPITQKAAWGVVASDLLFGATPSTNTFTNNMYTRVLPAQGCFNVNTRTYDANGFAHDTQTAIRRNPTRQEVAAGNGGNPVCGTPYFEPDINSPVYPLGPCSNGIGDAGAGYPSECAFGLLGSLCVGFGFNPQHPPPPPFRQGPACNAFTRGKGGPYPVAPSAFGVIPATANLTQAGEQFVGYLLQ
jgi:hypothetical protein